MLGSAVVVFRETLEAALIVAIVMGASRGVAARGRWIAGGVVLGIVGALVVAAFAGAISEAVQGRGQELFNAAVLLVAVAMLAWHNVWMSSHARKHVEETLHAVDQLRLPTLWFWPNPDAGSDGTSGGIRRFRELEQPENIHFFKNMAPADFLRLIYNSRCLIGNSSVGIRECSYLGVPVVNMFYDGSEDNGALATFLAQATARSC